MNSPHRIPAGALYPITMTVTDPETGDTETLEGHATGERDIEDVDHNLRRMSIYLKGSYKIARLNTGEATDQFAPIEYPR